MLVVSYVKRAKYKITFKLLLQLSKNEWRRAGIEHEVRKVFLFTSRLNHK